MDAVAQSGVSLDLDVVRAILEEQARKQGGKLLEFKVFPAAHGWDGVVLVKMPVNLSSPWTTWRTHEENGRFGLFYWVIYHADKADAEQAFKDRVSNLARLMGKTV